MNIELSRRQWLRLGGSALAVAAAAPFVHADSAVQAVAASSPIRLNFNESAFGPSPKALAAIRGALGDVQRYVGADEVDALIAQIARIENVDPAQVLVGEVLEALGAHLAQSGPAGGEFIYSEPGYTALVDAVAPYGGKVVPVPLDAQWQNDLPAIAKRIGTATRAVFLVNPHNPSGTVTEVAAFKQFITDAAARTLVIVDEAYLDYTDDAATRSAAAFVRERANVIVFRTLSKIHGLAGIAIGYAIGPAALVAELRRRVVGGAHSLNRLSLVAARASLEDHAYLRGVRTTVTAERAQWNAVLDELGLRHSRAVGNFVFFDSTRPHAEVAAALLSDGIRIARAFPPYATWVRISIGLPAENARARAAIRSLLT